MHKTSHWYRFYPFICQFHQSCGINAREYFQGQLHFSKACWELWLSDGARLILITMDNGRGHCAWWQSCTVPNQTHRGIKKMKMYAIKQNKICAEYRDMLPRPRLDLSGTPGLRPIGLSPGYWQTSLGLGSMSRYSANILICLPHTAWNKPTLPHRL